MLPTLSRTEWLLSRRGDDALADPSLAQLADGVRSSSSKLVDVMLVARTGKVRRLQRGNEIDGATLEGSEACRRAHQVRRALPCPSKNLGVARVISQA